MREGLSGFNACRLLRVLLLAVTVLSPVGVIAADDAAQKFFENGYDLLVAGNAKEAVAKFEEGLKRDPKNALAYFYLGEAYTAQGMKEPARKAYFQSLALDPSSSVAAQAQQRVLGTPAAASGQSSASAPAAAQGAATPAAVPALSQSPAPPPSMAAGTVFRDCTDCPEMVAIPPGRFVMGSPTSEEGRDNWEGPPYIVTIGKTFALGRYTITVGEFRTFVRATGYKTDAERNIETQGCMAFAVSNMKLTVDWRAGFSWDNPGFEQRDRHPVVCVSWNDAKEYVKWLAQKTGGSYQLPSSAQWEYAARAGTTTARFWGEDPDQACRYANVTDQSYFNFPDKTPSGQTVTGRRDWKIGIRHECNDGYYFTAPVGSYLPNAFGLYDMLGNADQWTEDCYNDGYAGAPQDGNAWTSGDCAYRIARGGSWRAIPSWARDAHVGAFRVAYRLDSMGFRVGKTLP